MHSSSPPSVDRIPRTTLAAAWIQDDLFSRDALHALLHGPLKVNTARTSRGRCEYSLIDLLDAAVKSQDALKPERLGKAARFVHAESIVPRARSTRWDVMLTPEWVERMRDVNVAFARACDLVDTLRLSDGKCARANVDWHAQIVMPGSPRQELHVDDGAGRSAQRCYYTMIVPLVDHRDAGGTYIPAFNQVFASYGSAIVFDGAVEHGGSENRSRHDRYFLYAAIYTGTDQNA